MCKKVSLWLKKRTLFPRTMDTMLAWLGLLLVFLLWAGERTKIHTITQIPDKLLRGEWCSISWINGDGMNLIYSWLYWFGLIVFLLLLVKWVVMIIRGERPSLMEKTLNELIKKIDEKENDKEDERHKELLEAIKDNRPIIYHRSFYGNRKQRKYHL